MARPKEFQRADALHAGIEVFWRKGFASTTTDDLATAMGIGRQSFYDTFGNKRQCYLDGLRTYARDEVASQFAKLHEASSPLEALRTLLHVAGKWTADRRGLGCMAVNAVAEFGAHDAEVVTALRPSGVAIENAVADLLRRAKALQELRSSVDVGQATQAILCTRIGLMLSAKAGQPPKTLRAVADFAIDQLARK